MLELGKLMREVAIAYAQMRAAAAAQQIGRAAEVLAEARRDLYRILADGDAG